MRPPESEVSLHRVRSFDLCRKRNWFKVERLCETNPLDVAALKSDDGYLLHVACRHQPTVRVVRALMHAFPEAALLPNEKGELPLHEACRFNASISVLRCLVQHTGGTDVTPSTIATLCNARESTETNMKTTNRSVLWHTNKVYLEPVNYASLFWQKMQVLLEAVASHRQLSQNQSTETLFLLHAAVSLPCCPTEVLQYCLDQYPAQISTPDGCSRLPLHIAVAMAVNEIQPSTLQMRQHRERSVIVRLMEAYPQASKVVDPNEYRGRYPLHTALVSGHRWNGGIKDLVHYYPSSLSLPDPVLGLYPFQMAVHDQYSVFQMLRSLPSELENSRRGRTNSTEPTNVYTTTSRVRSAQSKKVVQARSVAHLTLPKAPQKVSSDTSSRQQECRPPEASLRESKTQKVGKDNADTKQCSSTTTVSRQGTHTVKIPDKQPTQKELPDRSSIRNSHQDIQSPALPEACSRTSQTQKVVKNHVDTLQASAVANISPQRTVKRQVNQPTETEFPVSSGVGDGERESRAQALLEAWSPESKSQIRVGHFSPAPTIMPLTAKSPVKQSARKKESTRKDPVCMLPEMPTKPNPTSRQEHATRPLVNGHVAELNDSSITHSPRKETMPPTSDAKRSPAYSKYRRLISAVLDCSFKRPTTLGERPKGQHSWRRDSRSFLRSRFS